MGGTFIGCFLTGIAIGVLLTVVGASEWLVQLGVVGTWAVLAVLWVAKKFRG